MDEQCLRAARRTKSIDEFDRALSGPGEFGRIHTPHAGHVRTSRRIGDAAVSGKLIRLLTVLPAALTVPLTSDAAVATAQPPGQPESQCEVDAGRHGVGALAVLLSTTTGQDERPSTTVHRCGRRKHPSSPANGCRRHASHPLRPLGPPGRGRAEQHLRVVDPLVQVRRVRQTLLQYDVSQREHERQIRPRSRLQVDPGTVLGQAGRRRATRVDDQKPTRVPGAPQMRDRRRHRLRDVAADQQDGTSTAQIGQRERQPTVDAEGPVGRSRGGRHAEPAVVVHVRGLQRNPGELAQRVGLLVGETATTEHSDRVMAIVGLQRSDAIGNEVQRRVPARLHQVARRVAHQWHGEPVRHREYVGSRPALAAQAAPVGREVAWPYLHCTRPVDRVQGGRALQSAVRAVSGDTLHTRSRLSGPPLRR